MSSPWYQLVGERGAVIGIDQFGASAPAAVLFPLYGFSVENVVRQAEALLAQS